MTENDGAEHRIDERLAVMWPAVITIQDIEYSCEVANVSTAGALLKFCREVEMDQEVMLDIPEFGLFAGEVAWCNNPFYGIKIMAGPDLDLKRHADAFGLGDKE